MKTVCSYCGQAIKIQDGEDRVTSHGICAKCQSTLCGMIYGLEGGVKPAADDVGGAKQREGQSGDDPQRSPAGSQDNEHKPESNQ